MTRWFCATGIVVAAVFALGCGGRTSAARRTAWDQPDLSGVWKTEIKHGATPGQDNFNLTQLDKLYKPDARAKVSPSDDPALNCKASPYPRALTLGGPIQLVQTGNFLGAFTEAIPMHRLIPIDGRPHLAEDLRTPYYFGASSARWEGDTLVVDAISFNGEGWLASSADKPTATSPGVWPTSMELHVVERWRPVDADTVDYQARVEDPGVLTGPWETPVIRLKRQNVDKIEEHLCLLNDGAATYLKRYGYAQ